MRDPKTPAEPQALEPLNIPLEGANLIEASAGTGKTYTITTLYLRLVVELGFTVDQILVVTFTEAATAELRERIRNRLYQALGSIQENESSDEVFEHFKKGDVDQTRHRLKAALSQFDEAAVFTIHGFCHRMLKENAFESGVLFDLELVQDQMPLYHEIVCDFWAREVYNGSPLFLRYLEETAKVSIKNLIRLVATTVSQPDLEIVPGNKQGNDVEARFAEGYARVRAIWQKERTEISNLMQGNTNLKGNIYKASTVSNWLAEVDRYLLPLEPSRVFSIERSGKDKIDRFAASRIAKGTKKNCVSPEHPFFEAIDELIEIRTGFDEQVIGFKHKLIAYAEKELVRRKQLKSILSFDDLLHHLDQALNRGNPHLAATIRDRYRAVLVDEFQDTDRVQYRIFSRIYAGKNNPFFLIGDPKQSIYSFRGADVFSYLRAKAHVGNKRFTLGVNWRSQPRLIHAVNTLFSRVENPFVFDKIDFQPVAAQPGARDDFRLGNTYPAPLKIVFVERQGLPLYKGALRKEWAKDNLPSMVAGDIAALLNANPVIETSKGERKHETKIRPGHIAVLTETNDQTLAMQEALRNHGIPSIRSGTGSVFQTEEAFELKTMLDAVLEPGQSGKVRAALSTDLMGQNGNQIFETFEDDQLWEKWVTCFRDWHRTWVENGFIKMFHSVLTGELDGDLPRMYSRLLTRQDGERRVTNLLHLGELLHMEALKRHLGLNGLLQWFEQQLAMTGDTVREHHLRLESDDDAVKLVTIFKSKGLEYPVVYCPFLFSGALRNSRGPNVLYHSVDEQRATLDVGSTDRAEHLALAAREEMAEKLRLLYVAATRAKYRCVLFWGRFHEKSKSAISPLGYLLHNQGGNTDITAMGAHVASLSDEEIRQDLDKLVEEANSTIHVEPASFIEELPARRLQNETTALKAATLKRNSLITRQVTSFSKLASEKKELTPAEKEGIDHDRTSGVDKGPFIPKETTVQIPLGEFDAGPLPGSCLHEIFEVIDFGCRDKGVLDGVIEKKLQDFGFPIEQWQAPLSLGIDHVLRTGLDARIPDLTLETVGWHQRLNELEFILKVGDDDRNSGRITAGQLASVFARHATSPEVVKYAERIERLGFVPLNGFLKGFIDMIFEREGRYYLVDYKSNHLGMSFDDYKGSHLCQAMIQHHYFLQYHLYLVALHGYLRFRLREYDYDKHFGAVYYLFIRGMSPDTGPDCGVFRDRPPKELVEALYSLFKEGGVV